MQFLVILRGVSGVDIGDLQALAEAEQKRLWQFHQQSVISQIFYRADELDLVLLCQGESLAEVKAQLQTLPMVSARLFTLELMPLAPYTGFEMLFAEQSHPPHLPKYWLSGAAHA